MTEKNGILNLCDVLRLSPHERDCLTQFITPGNGSEIKPHLIYMSPFASKSMVKQELLELLESDPDFRKRAYEITESYYRSIFGDNIFDAYFKGRFEEAKTKR